MITGHAFRVYGGSAGSNGSQGGIATGMCAWLGSCNRPRAEHAHAGARPVLDPAVRAQIVRERAAGASTADLAERYGMSRGGVHYIVRKAAS